MIDSEGYRANVGIIVSNSAGKLLWCQRTGQDAWQFPQGGIEAGETAEQAVYRELHEETGIDADQVKLLGQTRDWLRYEIPVHILRKRPQRACIGQKQRWFLLALIDDRIEPVFSQATSREFEAWRWVDYWHPPKAVIFFKQAVYQQALTELAPLLNNQQTG